MGAQATQWGGDAVVVVLLVVNIALVFAMLAMYTMSTDRVVRAIIETEERCERLYSQHSVR